MKIGIITFCNTTDNYGQVLQAFALQKFLKKLGHDVYHIKYKDKKKSVLEFTHEAFKRVLLGDYFAILRKTLTKLKTAHSPSNKPQPISPSRGFNEFREKYITFTDKEYNQHSIIKNPPDADCYITGSDQVWAFPKRAYMLGFGDQSVKRIAYAPSLGGRDYSDKYYAREFRKYLKNIDIVTCREEDGAKVCHRFGRQDTEIVPDPVFLLPHEKYEEIITLPSDEGYLLLYLLGASIEINVQDIFDWGEANHLKIKYVASQGRIDEYPKVYPTVEEFLGLIKNAGYIITNSFHGIALSIIFNKQFLAIPIYGEWSIMNGRIKTTLSNLDLNNQLYTKSLDALKDEIDYIKVNSIIEKQREEIMCNFLHWLKV